MPYPEEFSRTIANKENTAALSMTVKPLPPKSGNVLNITANTRDIPEEIIEAIKNGVSGAFSGGIRFGYECTDIEADVTELGYDENTASMLAFTSAAAMAFDKAASAAEPVLMEPVMKVQVSVPSEYIGDVMSSLTQRGGIVISMESRANGDIINAEAPLEKMFGYTTALRSATQGRGSFSMEFSHYSEKM